MPSQQLVNATKARLISDFALFPVVATEIEFYLVGSAAYDNMPGLLNEIYATALASGIHLHPLEKERGEEQYEVAMFPGKEPAKVAADTQELKHIITRVAEHYGLKADFAAKPYADQPGSGLHVHVHLTTGKGDNVFFKEDDSYSDTLLCALGGMLEMMKECMVLFAPSRKSYARFVPGYNVPVTVSWGANNRTVAVRLPTKPAENKHIEHRVAGADADPALVIAAVLAGIHHGILHRVPAGEQIFGDASLPIYALEALPKDIRTALSLMQSSSRVTHYFGTDWCNDYMRQLLKQ